MRYSEIIDEGGESGGARYNSEVGVLFGLAGSGDPSSFNPKSPEGSFNAELLSDPELVFSEIKKFLPTNYKAANFAKWVSYSRQKYAGITSKLAEKGHPTPSQFLWVGGKNAGVEGSGVADVIFANHPNAGISIKDKGGITLSNLTPKNLGLEPVYGQDIFHTYAGEEYIEWKMAAVRDLVALAKSNPGKRIAPLKPKYSVTYNPDSGFLFTMKNDRTATIPEQTLLDPDQMSKNSEWQRTIGDYLQKNKNKYGAQTTALYAKIAKLFEQIIETHLQKVAHTSRVLQFSDKPYFYMTPKGIHYIPSAEGLTDLRLKGIRKAESKDATSLKFLVFIGRADSEDNAVIDVYVRYANGLFEANPTVRVQSLKNPEHIYWEKV